MIRRLKLKPSDKWIVWTFCTVSVQGQESSATDKKKLKKISHSLYGSQETYINSWAELWCVFQP